MQKQKNIIAKFALSDSSPKAERNLSSVGEFAREGELERRGEDISTGFPDLYQSSEPLPFAWPFLPSLFRVRAPWRAV